MLAKIELRNLRYMSLKIRLRNLHLRFMLSKIRLRILLLRFVLEKKNRLRNLRLRFELFFFRAQLCFSEVPLLVLFEFAAACSSQQQI